VTKEAVADSQTETERLPLSSLFKLMLPRAGGGGACEGFSAPSTTPTQFLSSPRRETTGQFPESRQLLFFSLRKLPAPRY